MDSDHAVWCEDSVVAGGVRGYDGHDIIFDLSAQHKKEMKELNGRIMALKKSVTKNDARRKKVVMLEIAQLEAEIRERHLREKANKAFCQDNLTAGILTRRKHSQRHYVWSFIH